MTFEITDHATGGLVAEACTLGAARFACGVLLGEGYETLDILDPQTDHVLGVAELDCDGNVIWRGTSLSRRYDGRA